MKSFAVAIVIALFMSAPMIATPAYAQPQPSVAVHYSDLNLARHQDRATLDARIRDAARQVCAPQQLDLESDENCQRDTRRNALISAPYAVREALLQNGRGFAAARSQAIGER